MNIPSTITSIIILSCLIILYAIIYCIGYRRFKKEEDEKINKRI